MSRSPGEQSFRLILPPRGYHSTLRTSHEEHGALLRSSEMPVGGARAGFSWSPVLLAVLRGPLAASVLARSAPLATASRSKPALPEFSGPAGGAFRRIRSEPSPQSVP